MFHSAGTYFGNISDQEPLKKGLGVNLGNRDNYIKELKFKRDLEDLKKQNKMLYSMAKWNGSRRELKKIRSKVVNKYDSYISSSSNSDSDSSISSHSE